MKDYLMATEKILQSSNCLTNALLCAVIEVSEANCRLMQVGGRNFIYLLCNNDKVIYVGRTKNLYTRLIWHKMYKSFTDIILIEYSINDISNAEKQIIKLLKPTLNRCWVHYGTQQTNPITL